MHSSQTAGHLGVEGTVMAVSECQQAARSPLPDEKMVLPTLNQIPEPGCK